MVSVAQRLDRGDTAVATSAAMPSATAVAGAADRVPAMDVLRAVANVLSRDELRGSLHALVTHLAREYRCCRVSLGIGDGAKIQIETVSDLSDSKAPAGDTWLDVQTAMEEAWSQGTTICVPPIGSGAPRADLAHSQLARLQSNVSVCSVPLALRERRLGVLTFQRDLGAPFEANDVQRLEHVAAFLCPLVELKLQRERPWRQRLALTAREHWWGPRRRLAVSAITAVAILALLLGFLPVTNTVSAPARLEGVLQRAVVAPRDGYIGAVLVRPGDTVEAGQPLAELERETMQFEQRRWESEVAKAESSFGEALAKQDRAEIVIQSARVAGAKAQLDLVENDLQRATLRAPFAGVVLEGDLTRSLGAPIRRGENLMTIAPAEGFRLMLKVDERDIASVQLGQRGRMVLAAQPGEALDIEVARITPLATAKEGRNTFEVEARVLSEAPSLRPGLEGVAKLPAERRSLYWLVSHRTIQWLQLSLWEWLG